MYTKAYRGWSEVSMFITISCLMFTTCDNKLKTRAISKYQNQNKVFFFPDNDPSFIGGSWPSAD